MQKFCVLKSLDNSKDSFEWRLCMSSRTSKKKKKHSNDQLAAVFILSDRVHKQFYKEFCCRGGSLHKVCISNEYQCWFA